MKSSSLLAAALVFGLFAVSARAEKWETDYQKALKTASTEKKMVLMDFTGSDWCPWCKKLDKEVFSQTEFKKFAEQNLVLVKLDFPMGFKLPMGTQKQNESLKNEYQIHGYPTVIVLNDSGKKVGQLGYMAGGSAKFIEELNKLPKS